MKLSIITPTLQRDSLRRCCESVDRQSYSDWEHIVQVDSSILDCDLVFPLAHPSRHFKLCGTCHQDFGNTCRSMGWERSTGDYVLYLDDDNFLAHSEALSDIAIALESCPEWAVFPILRHGNNFFTDDPRSCHTDTANMVVRRDLACWPSGPEYTMDGIFCDYLKARYPFAAFGNLKPIVIMETSNRGQ